MKKEIFMDNLYDLAEDMKIKYKELLGFAMFKGMDFLPNNVEEMSNIISKNEKIEMDKTYIDSLKSYFKNRDTEFDNMFNRFIISVLSFRNYYIENKDEIENNDYLDKRDFRIIGYMTNFNINFILSHLYKPINN